jgi:hypothetical protein
MDLTARAAVGLFSLEVCFDELEWLAHGLPQICAELFVWNARDFFGELPALMTSALALAMEIHALITTAFRRASGHRILFQLDQHLGQVEDGRS